jgi:hypothetical protein
VAFTTLVYVASGLRSETVAEVRSQAPEAELIELTAGPGPYYPDFLRARWRSRLGEDWILIEQDVVPPPGAIAGLLECPENWCTHPEMNLGSYITTAFGLVKFSAAFRSCYLELMDRSLGWNRWQFPSPCLKPGEIDPSPIHRPDLWPSDPTWFARDALFAAQAHKAGLREHVHQPPVTHFRSHGGVARPGEGVETAHVRRLPRFNDLAADQRAFPDRQAIDAQIRIAEEWAQAGADPIDAPVVDREPAPRAEQG